MVDRIEFSPLGGIDPRQLSAQREARQALINSLATEAPAITAPAPRPAPEAPRPAERPEEDQKEEQRALREEATRQGPEGVPGVPGGPGREGAPGQAAGAPEIAALGPEGRLGRNVFQLSVPGTDQARAEGPPLFGGLGPIGPENPLVRETAPLGEGGGRGEEGPELRPLHGAGAGSPAALGPQGPGAPGRTGQGAPAGPPQNTVPAPEGGEPRGAVVDVLV